jgi:hypothetical protein
MCGSVRHRDAETTQNKLRTDKSHLQIVGQNRMNGSVRDTNFLLQFHDGYSSMILNQLLHFFNQRNSRNFLTAQCIKKRPTCRIYKMPSADLAPKLRPFGILCDQQRIVQVICSIP